MSLPSEALDFPWPQAQIPSGVDVLLGLGDYISPSFYLRKGIEIVIGYDPASWLVSEFAGDWQKVSQAGTALEQLGEYMHLLAKDVNAARVTMNPFWDGNAADNASVYFEKLAVAIDELQTPLDDIAKAYATTATGIKSWGETINDLLGLLLDYLIELGIAAAATAASSWTGVGLAIGGVGTAYLAYKATSTWMKVVEAHGHASTAAKGVIGLTAGPLGMLHVDQDLELPTSAYDHPDVTR
ncbi:hypothetical protein ncot_17185 [Nocardioides sp. JQ2195]|uniref:hypothetical protein n=1 Tax=Nocardioides sp. JQ2195 TaxID=2592334 RepID=UPI00143EB66B|nr:hypothetical protein [Nocardioides sp. JQ2195]QIX28130.1 hypothetical protein ncot_17185 [Nocardioides sp. JQ2195]